MVTVKKKLSSRFSGADIMQINFNEKVDLQMGFRYRQQDGKIFLTVKEGTPYYQRYASKLIEDKVILDLDNAKKKLKETGDCVVYSVFNLWKSIDFFKELYRKTWLVGDLTLLNHGFFSGSDGGELFCTYGHAHEKYFGEVYTVLKNGCFLILTHRSTFQSFVVWLKEGASIFIHPDYMHRMTVHEGDCLFLTLAPEKAGHNYQCVRGRGFPVSIFYNPQKGRVEVKRNTTFIATYNIVKRIKKIDALNLVRSDPEKLKEILEDPEKYVDYYFRG
ncbi:MAG: glucose-6-phosphate isomerase family protein [Candidatus Bathyarchaeia archaeon]